MFDFDNPPSRAGTNAEKYTARERLFGREDVMPFWVADMEFAVAPYIGCRMRAASASLMTGATANSISATQNGMTSSRPKRRSRAVYFSA
ncbi:MAG: hypothetical protein OEM01_08560 [Desulfobulbaceae bacterium]|nr:hypothetical protein [Desulfobulbaceae bacterium]